VSTTAGFVEAPLVERRDWTQSLVTLRVAAELDPFEPGQFVSLAAEVNGELMRRPYSLASAPGADPEFYLTRVDDGSLTPRLFELPIGTKLMIERKPQGFFTLKYVPDAPELWLLASGTGLGPFIAMIRSGQLWNRFGKVVVVHGVRYSAELGYREELRDLERQHQGRFVYVPAVTRDQLSEGVLQGRITQAFASGELERAAQVSVSPDRSHLMLCGNPEMIRDMTEALHARGLRKHRVRQPGHYTIESYW
jgi:ferredoxin--NADP+ reductase